MFFATIVIAEIKSKQKRCLVIFYSTTTLHCSIGHKNLRLCFSSSPPIFLFRSFFDKLLSRFFQEEAAAEEGD